jgi:branched-subunit amino acid aminotransferase/4-amino-4-deoxychorismate lyase
VIYLNGTLVPPEDAAIDPADRGFLLGDGLFETLRAYRGRVPWLGRHLDRLAAGAALLAIPLPALDLTAAVAETLGANDLAAAAGAPLRAMIAATRRNEHSRLANLKTLNYLDNVLARREAAAAGADDGLLLNTAGRLASASAGNLFLVRQRTLLTPPTSEGVLPGITRAVVLDLAPDLGLTAVETPLEPDQLDQAHEAFVTNSLIELRPLVAVDGRPIGDGAPGPATGRLLHAYRERLADEV